METKEYDEAQAKAYILDCFQKQGDFSEIADEKKLDEMVSAVMKFDAAFMHETGADEDAVYDGHYEIDRRTPTMHVRAWRIAGSRPAVTYGLKVKYAVVSATEVELRIHFVDGEPERSANVHWLRGTNESTSPQCIEMLTRVRDWAQGPSIQ